jgi:hypothetical protein
LRDNLVARYKRRCEHCVCIRGRSRLG